MTRQVAEVKKPLASVGRMCDAGNVAVFTKDGGYVVPNEHMEEVIGMLERMDHSTLRMKRENGDVQLQPLGADPPKEVLGSNRFQELQELDEEDVSDFQRRGVHLM